VRLRWPDRRPRRLALEGVITAAASQLLAVLVLGTWSRQRLAQPLDGRLDVMLHASFVRSMQLNGWYSAGPHLGAPNGQDMADFPLGPDHVHLAALRLMAELPISAITVVNLYYLLSFGVVAGLTHLTLRSLGSAGWPAAAASLLYAFLPYHFSHGPGHLFLSMYVAIPLAVLLAVWVGDGRLSWRSPRWRWVVAGVCVVVVGSASGYYAVFGATCIVSAALIGAIRDRRARRLVVGLATAAAVALVVVANVTPTLLHRRAEGENTEVAARTPTDSEVYGLRLATLVVPEATHRIPTLARVGRDVNAVPLAGEPGSYLGFAGVLGLAVLLGSCLAGLGDVKVPPVLGLLAGMFLIALLVAARGGGGFLIALAGFTNIRAWGRLSLLIALLGLGALALVATAATKRFGTVAVAPALAVLVVVGLLDQVPLHPVPDRATNTAEMAIERKLILEMEAALPAGAAVYQLPYHRFPEAGPRERMIDYDLLRPYVLGRGHLRWSYGGLKGRSADWQELWASQPLPVLLRAVAAAGFLALWVDRRSYADGADQMLSQLTDLTGAAPRMSDDGMLAWLDLRPYRDRTVAELGADADAVGTAVTSIPRAVWKHGFAPLSGPALPPRLVKDGAVLELRPAHGGGQAVVLLLGVDVPDGATIAVETAQGTWRSSGPGMQQARLPVQLGGRMEVRFELDGIASVSMTVAPVDANILLLLPDPAPAATAP